MDYFGFVVFVRVVFVFVYLCVFIHTLQRQLSFSGMQHFYCRVEQGEGGEAIYAPDLLSHDDFP